MPELPEVETVRTALSPILEGRLIRSAYVGRDNLRWRLPSNLAYRLTGRRFLGLERRGKYILMMLDSDEILLLHLGMSGSVRVHETRPALGKHDHFMLEMEPRDFEGILHYVVLNDPRRFGWIDLFARSEAAHHRLLASLGPEPLGNEFSGAHLAEVFKGRSGAVKNALLNQKLVAGIGNIYASEVLFNAGISPRRKAGSVFGLRAERLAEAVVKTLRAAIECGGTSLRDHIQPGGEIGYFVQRLAVYGRGGQPCQICTAPIKVISQSGRSSFFCSCCQR